MQIAGYLCPSDANVPVGTTSVNGVSRQIGYTSYPNNIGTLYFNNNRFDGPAYRLAAADGIVTIATVIDGTSNTVIWSEWVRGKNNQGSRGLHQTYVAPQVSKQAYNLDTLAQSCQASQTPWAETARVPWDQKGRDWLFSNCAEGGGYCHVVLPNQQGCFFSDETSSHTYYTVVGASSNHSGGVNVGLLDGSVKFIKESVSPTTWWAIATTQGARSSVLTPIERPGTARPIRIAR